MLSLGWTNEIQTANLSDFSLHISYFDLPFWFNLEKECPVQIFHQRI
jgi:hypothetical protein